MEKRIGCRLSDVTYRPQDGFIVRTDYDQVGNVIGGCETNLAATKDLVDKYQAAIRVAESQIEGLSLEEGTDR